MGDTRNNFDSAIRLNPNIADWYGRRGDVYAEAGGFSEAAENYNQALGMDDTLLLTHRNRAFANLARGHLDEATKEFDLCAERAPHDPYIAPPQFRNLEDCEAAALIGEYQLLHGETDLAQMMFLRVNLSCHPATLAPRP